MQEVTTYIGLEEMYSITIEGGIIVRITYKNSFAQNCFIPETSVARWQSQFLESDVRYIWWFSTLCTLRVYSADDFEIICREAIKKTGEYNLAGLREVYDNLNNGAVQNYCREIQRELQELLNW